MIDPMAHRPIRGYHQDEHGDWVAELACGHQQHLRHRPPFQEREWVITAEGRRAMLGAELECHFCEMPQLPEEARRYKRTSVFDEHSIPAGLLAHHRTRAGTWGRIVVHEGTLLYLLEDRPHEGWLLRPGIDGTIAPQQSHRLSLQGPVRFHVEFLRAPS
jgi:tellurite resistance-related uncharacterized protein